MNELGEPLGLFPVARELRAQPFNLGDVARVILAIVVAIGCAGRG
jgi:hypothetical protein